MKFKPNGVKAQYINSDADYTLLKLMGNPLLVFGDGLRKKQPKMSNGVAFKNTNMVREVAENLIKYADALDTIEAMEAKAKEIAQRRTENDTSNQT